MSFEANSISALVVINYVCCFEKVIDFIAGKKRLNRCN